MTSEIPNGEFAGRLARLERANELLERKCLQLERRAWISRGGWLCVTFGLIAFSLSGFAKFDDDKVVEADQFVIRDKHGVTRFSVSLTEGDHPVVELFDEKENIRMVLGENTDGEHGLYLSDKDEHPRAKLGTMPNGAVGVSFFDPSGIYRVGLGVREDKSADLHFRKGKEDEVKDYIQLNVDTDGSASFLLLNKEGDPLFKLPK